ncbi:hypothetical protein [Nonomuraea sp. NPDC050643]|uniref:hypothetical protein n=1 Tax=Nonomuraea sp. NPDC050643 TaxID=3155660 RepID=UPI0033D87AD6
MKRFRHTPLRLPVRGTGFAIPNWRAHRVTPLRRVAEIAELGAGRVPTDPVPVVKLGALGLRRPLVYRDPDLPEG